MTVRAQTVILAIGDGIIMAKTVNAQLVGMEYIQSLPLGNPVEINGEGFTIWGDNIDDLVEEGTVFRADTIEELAEQIDIDPAVLKDTHDTFNSYVESGVDADFGRAAGTAAAKALE